MPWQGAVRIQWQLTFTVQRPPLTGVGRGSPPGVAPQLRGGQQGLPGALWRREVEASGHSVSRCGAFCWRGCSWSRQDWPGVDAPVERSAWWRSVETGVSWVGRGWRSHARPVVRRPRGP